MEFSIKKSVFSEALSLVTSVVPERSARAVLQNLMLTGNEDNTITLSATDLEIGLKITLDVENIREPAAVLLPASRLNALIKGAYADDIFMSIQDSRAEIKTKQGKFQIPGLDTTDYPTIPDFKGEGAIIIHGDDFADGVQKTIFSTAKGDTRYALNGIYLSIGESQAEFVSSDTHRLSLVQKTIKNPDNVTCDGIILVKGMSTLARLAVDKDVVEIALTANEMVARTSNATLVIRRVEGMFPRYHDVIPAKIETTCTVNRNELLHSLQNVGIMASDESKSVIFTIASGLLSISANSENGEGDLTLDAEVNGPEREIKFNYAFVIDVLKNLSEEKVTIQYQDADSPARIDSGDFMYVLMPINR
jgi:DNA polymerase III, beta subunit